MPHPGLPRQPRRDAAHGGETIERLVDAGRRQPPFFERRQRLREREPAGQPQLAVASDDLHLDFWEIKLLQRRENLRQPRPVQIGGQPVGFWDEVSRFKNGSRISSHNDN